VESAVYYVGILVVLSIATFGVGFYIGRRGRDNLKGQTLLPPPDMPSDAVKSASGVLTLKNPEKCPISVVSFEQIDERFESEIIRYLREETALAAERLQRDLAGKEERLDLSDVKCFSLEITEKIFELAEKLRGATESGGLNEGQIVAFFGGLSSPEDGGSWKPLLPAIAAFTTPATLATIAACAALLACWQSVREAGRQRKLMTYLVSVGKLQDLAHFANGYTKAHNALRRRCVTSHEFTAARQEMFTTKWLYFRRFELDIANITNARELIAVRSNLVLRDAAHICRLLLVRRDRQRRSVDDRS
jgi:hypothetical protein